MVPCSIDAMWAMASMDDSQNVLASIMAQIDTKGRAHARTIVEGCCHGVPSERGGCDSERANLTCSSTRS